MARTRHRYVRQMPRIYGNLQPQRRDYRPYLRSAYRLLWVAAGAGAAYLLLFGPAFRVRSVEVTGTRFADTASIRADVPVGESIWLVSKKQITTKALGDPAVSAAAVLRGLPDTVQVVIDEKRPAVLWESGPDTVVLDPDGVPFREYSALPAAGSAEAKALEGLPAVRDTKALPVAVGQQVVGHSFLSFVTEVQKQVAGLLPQVEIDHFEVADSTYDLAMVSKAGLRVEFNSLGDAGVQVRNLARLVRQGKAGLSSRVDLRVDRWAYVSQ